MGQFIDCGRYEMRGVLRQHPDLKRQFHYAVLEETQSAMMFSVTEESDLAAILPFLDKATTIEASLFKKLNGTRGEINRIKKIELRLPNPLAKNNLGLSLVEKAHCLN